MSELKYKLRDKITPGAFSTLCALGLDAQGQDFVNNLYDVFKDGEKLYKVMMTIFEDDFSDVGVDEIDLGKVRDGISDFFSVALNGWNGFRSITTVSSRNSKKDRSEAPKPR